MKIGIINKKICLVAEGNAKSQITDFGRQGNFFITPEIHLKIYFLKNILVKTFFSFFLPEIFSGAFKFYENFQLFMKMFHRKVFC